jgi:hypothetical protein
MDGDDNYYRLPKRFVTGGHETGTYLVLKTTCVLVSFPNLKTSCVPVTVPEDMELAKRAAVRNVPETDLPIRDPTREILVAMKAGWRGR